MVNAVQDAPTMVMETMKCRRTIQFDLAIPLAVASRVRRFVRAITIALCLRSPFNVAEQLRDYALALAQIHQVSGCEVWFLRLWQRLNLSRVFVDVDFRVIRHEAQTRRVFARLIEL